MKPSDNFNMDVHVDADFAGLWPYEDKEDPTCVKSRTGCVICIADCPVVWGSKLQGSIALSTTEAEHNALSMVMRLVLPLRDLYKTIGSSLASDSEVITNFQDNSLGGQQCLPNLSKLRTRKANSKIKALCN